jgi:hypothetical protein
MPPHLNWYVWGLDNTHGRTWLICVVISLLLYVPVCAATRRRQRLHKEREDASASHEKMTLEEAYAIKTRLAEQEFPRVFSAAIGSVFFKVRRCFHILSADPESALCTSYKKYLPGLRKTQELTGNQRPLHLGRADPIHSKTRRPSRPALVFSCPDV